MKARANSDWAGTFREGRGSISTTSAVLDKSPYSFASRFEGAPGASPEELLAAAHAACYNHALANIFAKHDLAPGTIHTIAEVDLGTDTVAPGIKSIHLVVTAKMPEVTDELFQQFAQRAGRTCAISQALQVEITVTATLHR